MHTGLQRRPVCFSVINMLAQRIDNSSSFIVHRLIISLLAFIFLLTIANYLLPIAHAQTTSTPSALTTSPSTTYSIPSYVSPTSPLYTDLLVNNLFHSFSCLAVGQSMIGQPCLTYQITKNAQGALQGIPVLSQINMSGGTLGATTSLIGTLYQNPPVRTADYLASIGQGMGIVKTANAQVVGSGAAVLNPILRLWQVSRNISYVIMIIIFVVIGLMVMFRNKLNPQTVITAQAALPGLVIGLIMITFSYFLAGLISDMAFAGTNVVGYYFAAAQGKTDDTARTNLVYQLSNENILSVFSRLTGIINRDNATDALNSVWNVLSNDVKGTLRILAGLLAAQFVGPLAGSIPPPWGLIAGPAVQIISGLAVANSPTFFLGMILGFIATLALIYQMLKLLLRLISSYLTIIFLTLSAPFQFLFASLPGRQGVATGWILNMVANILVFPAVLAVLYFVAFMLGQTYGPLIVSQANPSQNNSLLPVAYAQQRTSVVDNAAFPLFGGMNLDFIRILLAFGALMALPSIPDIIIKSVGRAGQAGQIIGQEIGGGLRSGRGYAGQIQGAAGGAAGGLKQNLLGETQWVRHGTQWEPWGGRPGLKDIRNISPKSSPSPGTPPPGGGGGGGVCLPPDTSIATPTGPKAVRNLKKGDIIWTTNFHGRVKTAPIQQVGRSEASKNHKILKLVLADGRQLLASPGHPDAFGKNLALLRKGDSLDNSYIVKRELLPYHHKYTYDILPEGETGAYFADNILIGSTLKKTQSTNSLNLFRNLFSV